MKCPIHPTYKGIRRPTTKKQCVCNQIYAAKLLGIEIVIDPTLPRDQARLVAGKEIVHIVKLKDKA